MALDKGALEAELLGIFTDMETRTTDSKNELASRLATAIDTYVKTGQVASGIPVATTGTAAAQTGTTTSPASII